MGRLDRLTSSLLSSLISLYFLFYVSLQTYYLSLLVKHSLPLFLIDSIDNIVFFVLAPYGHDFSTSKSGQTMEKVRGLFHICGTSLAEDSCKGTGS